MIRRWIESILRRVPVYRVLLAERDAAVRARFVAEDGRLVAEGKAEEAKAATVEAARTVIELAREKDDLFKRWIDWQAAMNRNPTVFYPPAEYPVPPRAPSPVTKRTPTAQQVASQREREFEEMLANVRAQMSTD